jgi:hypothetical protein
VARYNDAGVLQGTALGIARLTGHASFSNNVSAGGNIATSGSITASLNIATTGGDITAAGNIGATTGTISAAGNITSTTGNLVATAGVVLVQGAALQFGGSAASGVFWDGNNVALRAGSTGSVRLQNLSAGVTYASFGPSTNTIAGNTSLGGNLSTITPNSTFLASGSPTPVTAGMLKASVVPGTACIVTRSSTDASNWQHAFENAAGTVVGTISCTGAATAYATSSDERLKEDLKSFDAGNVIDDTNVYDFAWKSTGERAYGVLAQQAVEVYPAAVVHTEDQDWWGVDYGKYVPVLLQELKALRARVAELEGKVGVGVQPA